MYVCYTQLTVAPSVVDSTSSCLHKLLSVPFLHKYSTSLDRPFKALEIAFFKYTVMSILMLAIRIPCVGKNHTIVLIMKCTNYKPFTHICKHSSKEIESQGRACSWLPSASGGTTCKEIHWEGVVKPIAALSLTLGISLV